MRLRVHACLMLTLLAACGPRHAVPPKAAAPSPTAAPLVAPDKISTIWEMADLWTARVAAGNGSVEANRFYLVGDKAPALEAFQSCRERAVADHDRWGEATCLWAEGKLLDPALPVAESRARLEEAMAIVDSLFGGESAAHAAVLTDIGTRYLEENDFKTGGPILEKALGFCRGAHGPDSVAVAVTEGGLAQARIANGDPVGARAMMRDSLRIWELAQPESANVAIALTGLALVELSEGDALTARPYAERALELAKKNFGEDDRRTAAAINNLADVEQELGEGDAALALFERSLAIEEKAPPSVNLVGALNNVALSELDVAHDLDAARANFERAAKVDAELFPGSHSEAGAFAIGNLADVLETKEDLPAALALRKESVALLEKLDGPDHPLFGDQLGRLGLLELHMGDLAAARAAFRRSLAIQERALGSDSHETARTRYWLALERMESGDFTGARANVDRAAAIDRVFLDRMLAVGSEREQRAALEAVIGPGDAFLLASKSKNEESARWALGVALAWKGRAFDMLSLRRDALLEKASPADVATLGDARRQLARATLDEAPAKEIAEAQARVDQLEKKIAALAGVKPASRAEPGGPDVCRAMPHGAALVEMMTYGQFQHGKDAEPHALLAMVLRKNPADDRCRASVVDLGPEEAIDAAVRQWRDAMASDARRYGRGLPLDEAALASAGMALRARAWAPLEKSLAGASRVFLAPDGTLDAVPFGALPGAKKPFLVEEVALTMLTTGRDLLRVPVSHPGAGTLVVAAPDFDAGAVATAAAPAVAQAAPSGTLRAIAGDCVALAHTRWPPLPDTAAEARDVAVDARVAPRLLTGRDATPDALLAAARGRRVVHIATHGFFVDGTCVHSPNPLTRSGLVMAGANHGAEGYLTALQVSGADFRGVQLVTLSACETGLGEIRDGEGIFGLTRAFLLAGADGVVLSLFKVPGTETADLMSRFYRALDHDHAGSADALRSAQLAVLADRRARHLSTHPLFWGAFQAVGGSK